MPSTSISASALQPVATKAPGADSLVSATVKTEGGETAVSANDDRTTASQGAGDLKMHENDHDSDYEYNFREVPNSDAGDDFAACSMEDCGYCGKCQY